MWFILSMIILFSGAEWSYSGGNGPDFWGLRYPACAKAKQSPISIRHETANPDDTLTSFKFFGYDNTQKLHNLTVWNDGYTGIITLKFQGSVSINNLRKNST